MPWVRTEALCPRVPTRQPVRPSKLRGAKQSTHSPPEHAWEAAATGSFRGIPREGLALLWLAACPGNEPLPPPAHRHCPSLPCPGPPLLLRVILRRWGPQEPTCMVAMVVCVAEARVGLVHGTAGVVAQFGPRVRVALACLDALPPARLVLVIGVVLLVLNPQPLCLLHKGALLALAQQAAEPRAQSGWQGHPSQHRGPRCLGPGLCPDEYKKGTRTTLTRKACMYPNLGGHQAVLPLL